MKFTLCSIGSWGDVAPFISLGRKLLERGAGVLLAAPPEFAVAAADAGLDFRSVAPSCMPVVEAASAMTGVSLKAVPMMLGATRRITEETLAGLPSIAEGSQMLVATGIAYGVPHVAESLGIPYRALSACPRWYPSKHHPPVTDSSPFRPKPVNLVAWRINEWITDRMLDEVVNRWRDLHGLKPASMLYTRMIGLEGERLLVADEELAPLPEDVEGTRRVSAIELFEPMSIPGEVEEFLASGDPPVCIGFGSMSAPDAGRLLDIVFSSAAALGIRTIVPEKWMAITGRSTPDGCLAAGYVPFSRLFPRLAAVVHHGGAGTTTTAARAGVPQLVVPHVMDQHYWGYRVHKLGIGPVPPGFRQLSPRTLTAALRETLGSSVMLEKVRLLSGQLDGRDGAGELASLLCDDIV